MALERERERERDHEAAAAREAVIKRTLARIDASR